MTKRRFSRRHVLKASTIAAAGLFASPSRSAAPEATAITPELVEAARKEGKVHYYTSIDLPLAEKIARSFEAAFPGVSVRVERSGAERVFQRIGQEYASRIYGVDVVNSSDAAHFIVWKRDGLLAPFVPADVAKHYPAEHKDPDGMFASFRVSLSAVAYNTDLVKREEAPASFADLLDPKWTGKIVKAHPSYSGTILTATFQIVRDLGWEYLEKLAKQKVMQVQSATDPPKKLALGERAIMADGGEYNVLQIKESGGPVPMLLLYARMPATDRRFRRVAVDASPGQGQGRPQAVPRHQDHEGGPGRRRKDERGDQGALQQTVRGVSRRA